MNIQKKKKTLLFLTKAKITILPVASVLLILTACSSSEETDSAQADLDSVNMEQFNQAILNGGFKPVKSASVPDATVKMFAANTNTSTETAKQEKIDPTTPKQIIVKKQEPHKPKPTKEGSKFPVKTSLQDNVSQQFLGSNDIEQRLIEALPEIAYHTEELPEYATKVNSAEWSKNKPLDKITIIRIQALLNWHNHGVGAVDGKFSRNTIKAMQTFQKARGITPTKTMTQMTWDLLTADNRFEQQPALVQYTLKKEDTRLLKQWGGYKNMQYRSVQEQLAEKFHMSRSLLTRLNPNIRFKSGKTITVYNPGQPNTTPVHRVEIHKRKNLLVAFDDNDKIVASYPTTIGSKSPNGTYHVANRVIKPSYNSDFTNKSRTLPPGPNNPVGLVWMGLSKPSFGIHGSPQPEMISRQRSHGCVRLTNWDALALYGTMQERAKVEFKKI